ncbi:unnamed protein product [Amoebophrya sp. A120]|nr:unnamed protein product [Amoebophrya sp. A120]|eukprot:GSA120T00010840001.1
MSSPLPPEQAAAPGGSAFGSWWRGTAAQTPQQTRKNSAIIMNTGMSSGNSSKDQGSLPREGEKRTATPSAPPGHHSTSSGASVLKPTSSSLATARQQPNIFPSKMNKSPSAQKRSIIALFLISLLMYARYLKKQYSSSTKLRFFLGRWLLSTVKTFVVAVGSWRLFYYLLDSRPAFRFLVDSFWPWLPVVTQPFRVTYLVLYKAVFLRRMTSPKWSARMEFLVEATRSPQWIVHAFFKGDGLAYLRDCVQPLSHFITILDKYELLLTKASFPGVRIQRHPRGIQSEPCRITWFDFPGPVRPQQSVSARVWNWLFPDRNAGAATESFTAPTSLESDDAGLIFYCHGGGYNCFTGDSHSEFISRLLYKFQQRHGKRLRACVPDYRRPPDHPFPTAVNDCVDSLLFVYRTCPRYTPQNTYLVGDSAGGGLCVAVQLVLKERNLHHLMPACSVLISPWVDLTDTGYKPVPGMLTVTDIWAGKMNKTANAKLGQQQQLSPQIIPEMMKVTTTPVRSRTQSLENEEGEVTSSTDASENLASKTTAFIHVLKNEEGGQNPTQLCDANVEDKQKRKERKERRQILLNNKFPDCDYVNPCMLEYAACMYCPDAKQRGHPLCSPLYGDLVNLPPMLIQTGGGEMLRKQNLKFASRARAYGVDVQLLIYEDMPHVFQFFTPFVELSQQAHAHAVDFLEHRIANASLESDTACSEFTDSTSARDFFLHDPFPGGHNYLIRKGGRFSQVDEHENNEDDIPDLLPKRISQRSWTHQELHRGMSSNSSKETAVLQRISSDDGEDGAAGRREQRRRGSSSRKGAVTGSSERKSRGTTSGVVSDHAANSNNLLPDGSTTGASSSANHNNKSGSKSRRRSTVHHRNSTAFLSSGLKDINLGDRRSTVHHRNSTAFLSSGLKDLNLGDQEENNGIEHLRQHSTENIFTEQAERAAARKQSTTSTRKMAVLSKKLRSFGDLHLHSNFHDEPLRKLAMP